MAKWLKKTEELCKQCNYWIHSNSTSACCDYISIEGHSRIFDEHGNRKEQALKGMCDCFKPRNRQSLWKEEGQKKWKIRQQRNTLAVSDVEEN